MSAPLHDPRVCAWVGAPHKRLALLVCCSVPVLAFGQAAEPNLPEISVSAERSIAEKNQIPGTTESITAARIADTINAMTVEDTIKYLPSILVRKRYAGDTQAPMATRTTGINASARSLLYVDGLLLSTLINNNNANGSPQWFMVTPEEVSRVDVMYGPFSAAYPGNAYGAVVAITTRMPTAFEGHVKVSASNEDFSQYGAHESLATHQEAVTLGNRSGDWAWRLNLNHLDSDSQPLTYPTLNQSNSAATAATPVLTGAVADRNRTGAPIVILGAGNLTHTVQDNASLKLAYDLTPYLKATYSLGYWENRADAGARSYMTTAAGAPYFGGPGNVAIGGATYSGAAVGALFSSNRVEQAHWIQGLDLASHNGAGSAWNWEVAASNVDFARDLTRTSTGLYPTAQTGGPGKITDASGTGWSTFDAKGSVHAADATAHLLTFGAHVDQYTLASPTFNASDWLAGDPGQRNADSRGKTRTSALWAQDLWQISPSLAATLGLRYEAWRAFDGFNLATNAAGVAFPVTQPTVSQDGYSPKATLAWQVENGWSLTGSVGRALRFPTVGELYQNVQTGTTFTQADPFLRPEKVWSGELALERSSAAGRLRVSLFEEHVRDALIAQTAALPGAALPVSFVQNIDRTRQRGIELAGERRDVLISGLELQGSVTYVDARILANSQYVATTPGASSAGSRTPYVPAWRATLVATYRPNERWAYTVAGRASTRMYATVDNSDTNAATYQGFQGFYVVDARLRYRIDRAWTAALGVDNLNNREYFLFHPFPQRTVVAELKFDF